MNLRNLLFVLLISTGAATAWAGSTCNQEALAQNDQITVGYGAFHFFDPLSNDRDADGDPLEIVSISNGSCTGSFQIVSGLVRYTPTGASLPGGTTSCTASYTITDGQSQESAAIVLSFPPAGIFMDGFESGSTTAWDEVVP